MSPAGGRAMLFTTTDVEAGDELVWDYGRDPDAPAPSTRAARVAGAARAHPNHSVAPSRPRPRVLARPCRAAVAWLSALSEHSDRSYMNMHADVREAMTREALQH